LQLVLQGNLNGAICQQVPGVKPQRLVTETTAGTCLGNASQGCHISQQSQDSVLLKSLPTACGGRNHQQGSYSFAQSAGIKWRLRCRRVARCLKHATLSRSCWQNAGEPATLRVTTACWLRQWGSEPRTGRLTARLKCKAPNGPRICANLSLLHTTLVFLQRDHSSDHECFVRGRDGPKTTHADPRVS